MSCHMMLRYVTSRRMVSQNFTSSYVTSLIFISVYLILHVCKPFAFVSWLIKAITYLLT